MIEVPDPDSIGRRLMGRYWPSWLAPQHLHFFPARNMETYLREAGFDPILWHHAKRAPGHRCGVRDGKLSAAMEPCSWPAVERLWHPFIQKRTC